MPEQVSKACVCVCVCGTVYIQRVSDKVAPQASSLDYCLILQEFRAFSMIGLSKKWCFV